LNKFLNLWWIYYRQSLGHVGNKTIRIPFPYFLFFSFLSAYQLHDTSFGLPEVPSRFRAQIFADTPLNVQSEGGTSSRNLGSPQICSRQIFAYWYARSALASRVFLPLAPPSCFIDDFYDFFGFLRVRYRCFPAAIIYLVKQLLMEEDSSEVDPLFERWICKIWIKKDISTYITADAS